MLRLPFGSRTNDRDDDSLRVFLSYRRDDSPDAAGRLYDALSARLGPGHVFLDVDTIDPAVDFEKKLAEALEASDVMMPIIGRSWLTVVDERGHRRLDAPNDYVRQEIEVALHSELRILPVLVNGVRMPAPGQLPHVIRDLAHWNALEMNHVRWGSDLERLIAALRKVHQEILAERVHAAQELARRERAERAAAKRHRDEERARRPMARTLRRVKAVLIGSRRRKVVAVAALLVTVAGVTYAIQPGPPIGCSPRPTPEGGSGVRAASVPGRVPVSSPVQQANKLLDAYASAYSRHDLSAIKQFFAPDICRYPGEGATPEGRAQALIELKRQFTAQEHDPYGLKLPLSYKLFRRRIVDDPTGVTASADFRVTAQATGTGHGPQRLGTGRIRFHIVVRSGYLYFDQVSVR